jgi:hypothetical protein
MGPKKSQGWLRDIQNEQVEQNKVIISLLKELTFMMHASACEVCGTINDRHSEDECYK